MEHKSILIKDTTREQLLASAKPSSAVVRIAVPATLALIARAVYNITDTAYIGMLRSDTSLAAVGVTVPLLFSIVSLENIFAAGAGILAARQLGSKDKTGASQTVSTVIGISVILGILLCVSGIIFISPLMRLFGASDSVLPEARQYAFWMFIGILFSLPSQSMNCALRAESSARISFIAVTTGAVLNVILDPVFMFSWGLNRGVEGASIATTISQFVTFVILISYYQTGHSVIKIQPGYFKPSFAFIITVTAIGLPSAVTQISISLASMFTNIVAKQQPDADLIIAAFGVVQRLMLIGCYCVIGLMQGYQPVASYAIGSKNKERFFASEHFTMSATVVLSVTVELFFILFAAPLIRLFDQNPEVVAYGSRLLISQFALFPVFGLCYMITLTFQTTGAIKHGIFLSVIRQGICYIPLVLLLPRFFGFNGICLAQPISDGITFIVCLFSLSLLKSTAIQKMR
jgi:putative MATE family efflux protein